MGVFHNLNKTDKMNEIEFNEATKKAGTELEKTGRTFLLLIDNKKDVPVSALYQMQGYPEKMSDITHAVLHERKIAVPLIVGVCGFLDEKGYNEVSDLLRVALLEIYNPGN